MKKLILCILAVLLILCSCSYNVCGEDVLYALTENMQGRQAGSEGGIMCGKYIENIFKNYGLDTSRGEFRTANSSPEDFDAILEGGGKRYSLGEDFYPAYVSYENSVEGKATFDIHDEFLENKILVTDSLIGLGDRKPLGVLIKSDEIIKYMTVYQKSMPMFCISRETYTQIKGGENIKMTVNSKVELKNCCNIVGKIKGEDSTQAIVVSAHYDGCGFDTSGEYKSAVDNASGVIGIIETIKSFNTERGSQRPKYDIAFVAFDGEEQGLTGSNYFLNHLEYEKVWNINLDCIAKEGNVLVCYRGENEMFAQEISSYLNGSEVCEGGGISDDVMFFSKGFPCVMITTLRSEEKGDIHTKEDTADKVDLQRLEKLGNDIAVYITKKTIKKDSE